MGEANRRKKSNPNYGKIYDAQKHTIYSTKSLPSSLAKPLKDILENYSEINEDTWESIYQSISLLVADAFLSFSRVFPSKKELLSDLVLYYHQKYASSPSSLADYPYYLISLFYKRNNELFFSKEEVIKTECDSHIYFKLLDEIIEHLLVLMPRDIVKGVTLYIFSKQEFIEICIDKSKESTQAMFNHERHFNKFLERSLFSGYNIWSRPLLSWPQRDSPFLRCQFIGNFGEKHGLVKMLLFHFSPFIDESDNFPVQFIDKIQTVLFFVYIELFKNLPEKDLRELSFDRIKYYSLSFCLFIYLALLSLDSDESPVLIDFEKFVDHFNLFVNQAAYIFSFDISTINNRENINLDAVSLDKKEIEKLNADIARYLYRIGLPKRQIFETQGDLEQLLSHQTIDQENTDELSNSFVKEGSDSVTSIGDEYRIQFSKTDVDSFLYNFFTNITTSDDELIDDWSNTSNFGFVCEDSIFMPNLSLPAILSKFFLYVEKFTTDFIENVNSAGSLTKPLGQIFERYVETVLGGNDFEVFGSLKVEDEGVDVIALYKDKAFWIECKTLREQLGFILGSKYEIKFTRSMRTINSGIRTANKWSKQKKREEFLKKAEIVMPTNIVQHYSLVIVPYPMYVYPYTKTKLEIEPDNIPVLTPEDFIALVTTNKFPR
ncbi:MAG: hypothetical protein QNJ33_04935 [Crocosphaera sp.]|nr:hypothetical protein [Crocosphaera sp.]